MTTSRHPDIDVAGSCACGAAALSVRGRVLAMFLCSCEECQRATGTGHAAVALVNRNAISVTGETRSFTRPAASGADLTRHFCPVCGTPLFATTTRAPERLLLPVGLFGAESDWFLPNQLIFSRSHREWDTIAADMPRHLTYRDEGTTASV